MAESESLRILIAEVVPSEKLIQYASKTELEPAATQRLVTAFAPVFAQARDALAGAQGVAESVKDATCVTEIRKSRACRLALRAVRIDCENIHKEQKQDALRYGRAVDGFRNILLADIEPVETALEAAENTAERAEAARKTALRAIRETELKPWLETPILINLGELAEEYYAAMLADAKLLRAAKLGAAAKAEAERLAREQAEREDRARAAAENARLKAEAEEAEAERKRIESEHATARRNFDAEAAKLRGELEARAKAETQAKAEAEAEEHARIRGERKAANAPDRQKLDAFAATLFALPMPAFKTAGLLAELKKQVYDLAVWCETKSKEL